MIGHRAVGAVVVVSEVESATCINNLKKYKREAQHVHNTQPDIQQHYHPSTSHAYKYEANHHTRDVDYMPPRLSAMSVYTGKFNFRSITVNENIFVVLLDGWIERGHILVFTTFTKDSFGVERCPLT